MDTPTSNKNIPAARHRERQKAETRALILEAARDLFERAGFEKTTMRALAARTQMGYGTIFKHFSNKRELLAGCLYEQIEGVLVEAVATMPADAGLKNQFMHVAAQLIRHYAQRPKLSKTLIEHLVVVDGSWKDTIDRQVDRFFRFLDDLIQSAKNSGEIRNDIENSLFALSFFSTYLSTLAFSLREPEFDPDKTIKTLDRLLDLHMQGVYPIRRIQ
jgi:AcrR family transcriptional regulator